MQTSAIYGAEGFCLLRHLEINHCLHILDGLTCPILVRLHYARLVLQGVNMYVTPKLSNISTRKYATNHCAVYSRQA